MKKNKDNLDQERKAKKTAPSSANKHTGCFHREEVKK